MQMHNTWFFQTMQMRKKYATFDHFCSDKMVQTTKQIVKSESERLLGDNLLKQILAKINAGNTSARRVANAGCQATGRVDNTG